jgi:hypothetical protein
MLEHHIISNEYQFQKSKVQWGVTNLNNMFTTIARNHIFIAKLIKFLFSAYN